MGGDRSGYHENVFGRHLGYQDADDGGNLTYVVIFEIVSVAAVSANYFSESLPPPPTAHWRRHVHSAGGGGGRSSGGVPRRPLYAPSNPFFTESSAA
jgi:hypothetical protein